MLWVGDEVVLLGIFLAKIIKCYLIANRSSYFSCRTDIMVMGVMGGGRIKTRTVLLHPGISATILEFSYFKRKVPGISATILEFTGCDPVEIPGNTLLALLLRVLGEIEIKYLCHVMIINARIVYYSLLFASLSKITL